MRKPVSRGAIFEGYKNDPGERQPEKIGEVLYKYYEGRLKIGNSFFGISYFTKFVHGLAMYQGHGILPPKTILVIRKALPIQNRSRMADKSCSMGK